MKAYNRHCRAGNINTAAHICPDPFITLSLQFFFLPKEHKFRAMQVHVDRSS